jgi:hypothetical protein
MPAPEIHLRVHHEPEERNWQLQKKNQRREPAKRSHARILIEPGRERKYFSCSSTNAAFPAAGDREFRALTIPSFR